MECRDDTIIERLLVLYDIVKNKDIFMDYNNANFYGVVFVKTTKTKLSIYTNLNLFSFF